MPENMVMHPYTLKKTVDESVNPEKQFDLNLKCLLIGAITVNCIFLIV